MENKNTDSHLRSLLNSPARFDLPWENPPKNQNASVPTTNATTKSNQPNLSHITVPTPSLGAGEPHTNIIIQNCVATVALQTTLDLASINARTRNSEYNPSRFHGIIMRLREPRSTALIFRSGKIVCTGAKNEHEALLASKKFARIIQKLGFNIRFVNFKVQNLVATCDLRFPIRLENLHQMHGQFSSYEPELFPGVVYRLVRPRMALLIFCNGKVVFTGAKSRDEIKEALDNIFPILKSFRKN